MSEMDNEYNHWKDQHPEAEVRMEAWTRVRDCYEGHSHIKKANADSESGNEYIPKMPNMSDDRYAYYVNAGVFVDFLYRTTSAVVSALFGKEPVIETGSDEPLEFFEGLIPKVSSTELFFKRFAKEVVLGRAGLLVDADHEGLPYLTIKPAESIWNWDVFDSARKELKYVVFKEMVAEDTTEHEPVCQYRVCELVPHPEGGVDEDGNPLWVYRNTLFRENDKGDLYIWREPFYPKKVGDVYLNKIPFYFCNPYSNLPEPDRPILDGLAVLNIFHWQLSCNLGNILNYVGQPVVTIYGPGASNADAESFTVEDVLRIDGEMGIDVKYLELQGTTIPALVAEIERTEQQMMVIGARMLEPPKLATESAEAQQIRRSGEANILSSLSKSISSCLEQAAQCAAEWREGDLAFPNWWDVKVDLSTEFLPRIASPEEIEMWLKLLDAQRVSYKTFWEAMQRLGWCNGDLTPEDELERIRQEVSAGALPRPEDDPRQQQLSLTEDNQ